MITGFKHRGLTKFVATGTRRGIPAAQAKRIRLILSRLDASVSPRDMNLPGLHLHELAGRRKGARSGRVTGNWQITIKFDGADAVDVGLED